MEDRKPADDRSPPPSDSTPGLRADQRLKCPVRFPLFRFCAVYSAILLLGALTLLPLCHALFSCGCSAFSDMQCNIHQNDLTHCPWCAHGPSFFYASYLAIALGTAIGMRLLSPPWASLLQLFLTAGGGYVASALALGFASAWYFHYPTFLGWPL